MPSWSTPYLRTHLQIPSDVSESVWPFEVSSLPMSSLVPVTPYSTGAFCGIPRLFPGTPPLHLSRWRLHSKIVAGQHKDLANLRPVVIVSRGEVHQSIRAAEMCVIGGVLGYLMAVHPSSRRMKSLSVYWRLASCVVFSRCANRRDPRWGLVRVVLVFSASQCVQSRPC